MDPFSYITALPSKNIRSQLIDELNCWLSLPSAVVEQIKRVINTLHNASLLIDDIEDGSSMRRGSPAAHTVFGVPLTINSANEAYFIALQEALEIPRICCSEHNSSEIQGEIARCFTQSLIDLHQGQGKDILWRETTQCPTLAEYEIMVSQKTGGLFYLAVKLMLLLTPPSRSLSECQKKVLFLLVQKIGVFYQILDDYLNLKDVQYYNQKSFCDDLAEGKFSYPVVHALKQMDKLGDDRLRTILRTRPRSNAAKISCLDLISGAGSFCATRHKLRKLKDEILAAHDDCGKLFQTNCKISKTGSNFFNLIEKLTASFDDTASDKEFEDENSTKYTVN